MWAVVWCWFAGLLWETPFVARTAHPWAPRRIRSRAIAWSRLETRRTHTRWRWARARSSCRACARIEHPGPPHGPPLCRDARTRRRSERCPMWTTCPTLPSTTSDTMHRAPSLPQIQVSGTRLLIWPSSGDAPRPVPCRVTPSVSTPWHLLMPTAVTLLWRSLRNTFVYTLISRSAYVDLFQFLWRSHTIAIRLS